MALVLYAISGNSAEWEFPITEPDGSVKDLTDATDLVFLVKRRIDDSDDDALVTSDPIITDAAAGLIEVRLTPADMAGVPAGDHTWGLQFTDGDGRSWEFPGPPLPPGRFIVRRSVVGT